MTVKNREIVANHPSSNIEKVFDAANKGFNYALQQANETLKDRGQDVTIDALIEEAYIIKLHAVQEEDYDQRPKAHKAVDAIIMTALSYPLSVEAEAIIEGSGYLPAKEFRAAKKMKVQFNHHVTDCLTFIPKDVLQNYFENMVAGNPLIRNKGRLPSETWEAIIDGMSAEVAVRSALTRDTELSVRPASAEEDLKGADVIIAVLEGVFSFDVKKNGSFKRAISEMDVTTTEAQRAMEKGYIIKKTEQDQGQILGSCLMNANHNGTIKGTRYISGADEKCQDTVKDAIADMIRIAKKLQSQKLASAALDSL